MRTTHRFKRIFLPLAFLVVLTLILWSFNYWVKWDWLSNHPNRIIIYIAFQATITFTTLLFLPLNNKAKRIEYISLGISLTGLILTLLATNNEKGLIDNTNSHNKKDTITYIPAATQKVNIKITPPLKKRSITLSGIVEDAESGIPLDSVALIINDLLAGYTNQLGRFHIIHPVDPSIGAIIISYQKKGYIQTEDNILISVKKSDVDLAGKRIKLNKL